MPEESDRRLQHAEETDGETHSVVCSCGYAKLGVRSEHLADGDARMHEAINEHLGDPLHDTRVVSSHVGKGLLGGASN